MIVGGSNLVKDFLIKGIFSDWQENDRRKISESKELGNLFG
jgi:hypothetical protein